VVYHLAAEHRDDVHPLSLYYDVNVGGAENIVYALEKHHVNKLIYTSTVAVYGLNQQVPNEESPTKPDTVAPTIRARRKISRCRWTE